MKSLLEISKSFNTDKSTSKSFLNRYEKYFEHIRDNNLKILELGVFKGGSLLMWREYFQNSLVVGLDINQCPLDSLPERVCFYQGQQNDEILLNKIFKECAPDGFDIIIDDASHVGVISRASFQFLFPNCLKKGGYYVIEDWGTGYWDQWPDGKRYNPNTVRASRFSRLVARGFKMMKVDVFSWLRGGSYDADLSFHHFGMSGFVKELVDEVAWRDLACDKRGNKNLECRQSMIREMSVYSGQIFLLK